MDPISALGLAASIIAVIELTEAVLKKIPVGSSRHDKDELRRLLSLACGFKGAYESLEYDLIHGEDEDSQAKLVEKLLQPAKECKIVIECLRRRLESVNFFKQHIIGIKFNKQFQTCIQRLKDEKELLELVMQVDEHAMLRKIMEFSQKTKDIILLIESSAEETGNRIETLADLNREQHEVARTHYDKMEVSLAEVKATVVSHTNQAEEDSKVTNRNAIVSWLSNTDPLSNHSAAKEKHENLTGNWFIKGDVYSEWLTNPGSLVWLHGMPGCGKSVLCSTIIDNTKTHCSTNASRNAQVAFYYFSFTDSEKQKPANLLRSIIAQLVRERSQIPEEVQSMYNSYHVGAPPSDVLKSAFRSVLEDSTESFVLIDALDECPSNDGAREQVCKLLVEICSWSLPGLHILATSRKKPDIQEILSAIISLKTVPIQNAEVNADIQLYVNSEIQKEPKLRAWAEKVEEMERTLVDKANGMFRWVFCQLGVLKQCRSRNGILRALETLPRTLDETYERILKGISEEDSPIAARGLRWLVFSKRPLQVEELAEAAILNPDAECLLDIGDRFDDPRDILHVLSSLVTTYIQDDVEIVSVAHFSVQEYLVSSRMQPDIAEVFGAGELSSEQMIAKSCLDYIHCYGNATAQNQLPISDRVLREDLTAYPLLDYCCTTCVYHFQTCETLGSDLTVLVVQSLKSQPWLDAWTRINKLFSGWVFSEMAPPLYWAVHLQLANVAKELVDFGANVNTPGGVYGNALQVACEGGNEAIVKLLLEKGANVGAQGGRLGNALQAACGGGNEAIVKLLLEKGVNVGAQGGFYGYALQAACGGGHKAIVKLLFEKEADANAEGEKDMVDAFNSKNYELLAELWIAREMRR